MAAAVGNAEGDLQRTVEDTLARGMAELSNQMRRDVREELQRACRDVNAPHQSLLAQEAMQQSLGELRRGLLEDLRAELRLARLGRALFRQDSIKTGQSEEDHEWMGRHMRAYVGQKSGGVDAAAAAGTAARQHSSAVLEPVRPPPAPAEPEAPPLQLRRGVSVTRAMRRTARMVLAAKKASAAQAAAVAPGDELPSAENVVPSGEVRHGATRHLDKQASKWTVGVDATPATDYLRPMDSEGSSVLSMGLREALRVRFREVAANRYAALVRMVNSVYFDTSVGLLVLFNAVFIGIQTDFVATNGSRDLPAEFGTVELFFIAVFCAELGLRLAVHRRRFFRMAGWEWNVFDCAVLLLQLMETALADVSKRSGSASLPMNLGFIRMLRVLRLIRVIRVIRILRLIGELRTIVTSIVSSLKFLGWTIVLLCFIIYLVGVYFTQLVSDYREPLQETESSDRDPLQHYFGTLGSTVLTLFMCITSGVDWGEVLDPLATQISPWIAVVFALYIAFAVLAMLNVVTGVVVESSVLSAKADKDFFMINNVRELFKSADGRSSREMTWESFMSQLDRPEMLAYFKAMDLDPSEARGLFRLLDMDNSGRIDEEEFLNGCLRLRGPAKALDLALVMKEMRRLGAQIRSMASHVDDSRKHDHSPKASKVDMVEVHDFVESPGNRAHKPSLMGRSVSVAELADDSPSGNLKMPTSTSPSAALVAGAASPLRQGRGRSRPASSGPTRTPVQALQNVAAALAGSSTTNQTTPMSTPRPGATERGTPMSTPRPGTTERGTPMSTSLAGTAERGTPLSTPRPGTVDRVTPLSTPRPGTTGRGTPMSTPRPGQPQSISALVSRETSQEKLGA